MELNSICHFTLELGEICLGNILANKLDLFFFFFGWQIISKNIVVHVNVFIFFESLKQFVQICTTCLLQTFHLIMPLTIQHALFVIQRVCLVI